MIAFFLRANAFVTLSGPRAERLLVVRESEAAADVWCSTALMQATCGTRYGLRHLLVELVRAVPIALLAPVKTADIHSFKVNHIKRVLCTGTKQLLMEIAIMTRLEFQQMNQLVFQLD